MAKLGPGRMPHIGSEIVDERGLRLVRDWITQISPRKDDRVLLERLRAAGTPQAQRKEIIGKLRSSTSGGLVLATALGDEPFPDSVRAQVLTAAMALPNSQVRELFERFVPDDQRPKRLGSVIHPEQILKQKGDAQRGKELFFKSAGLQCANCHRIAGVGSTLGPDLSEIGKKYTRAQILESILEPSKSIDPKYATYLVETGDGKVLTGLLAEKTSKEIVPRRAQDKEIRLPAASVANLQAQQTSLMPEGALRDLTAEQAADLLEFLASLK